MCGAGEGDAVVVTWGSVEDAECGAREIEIRAREATQGVPNETRQARKDNTTGFERILPGPDRMYPDTDLPPMALAKDRVARIRSGVPEPVWERRARLESMGLATDVVDRLQTSRWLGVFDAATGELGVDPGLAADLLGRRLRWLSRSGVDTSRLTDDMMLTVFRSLSGGEVAREGILPVLRLLLAEPPVDGPEQNKEKLSGVIAALGIYPVGDEELDKRISEVVNGFDFDELRRPDSAHRCLMGLLMEDLAGSADGALVSRRLERALEKRGGGEKR
jgi:glutamyl-tRNA(Gln) amidotransferase subunit E